MTPDEFRTLRPAVYHLTYPVNRAGIEAAGLRPAAELVAASSLPAREQMRLLTRPRPTERTLTLFDGHTARLRDNRALSWARLQPLVEGIAPGAFLRLLNSHVFLWPTRERVDTLVRARVYRNLTQLLITIPTASLSDDTLTRLHASRINSGATRGNARRSRATYVPLRDATTRQIERAAEYAVRGYIPADELRAATYKEVRA